MRPRLTYANVTATLALAAALGGGAYAATQSATTTTIRACASKRIGIIRYLPKGKRCNARTDRTLTWNVRGPRGLRGLRGAVGTTGAAGAAGQTGAPGEPGSAKAYAKISINGTDLPVTTAKGMSSENVVREGSTLIMCIRGLSFTPVNIVATAQPTPVHIDALAEIPPTNCPSVPDAQAQLQFMTSNTTDTPNGGTAFVLIN